MHPHSAQDAPPIIFRLKQEQKAALVAVAQNPSSFIILTSRNHAQNLGDFPLA